jgi:hypothetical protein
MFLRKRNFSDDFREKFFGNGNFGKHKISVFVVMANGFLVSNLPSSMPGAGGGGERQLHSITLLLLIFCFRQCCGFMTFLCGSKSGSEDPCLWLMDPDPSVFVNFNFQDANNKLIVLKSFPAYYFLKVHLHYFSKIKSQKEVTKQ